MSFCGALLCCVNKLTGDDGSCYDDATKVLEDYKIVRDHFHLTLEQKTTDSFWEIGMGTSENDFKRAVLGFFNQAWYPYALNNPYKNVKVSKVLYYSGHGVPGPNPERPELSPIPQINYSSVNSQSVEVVGPLCAGDWPLHHCGFLGLKSLLCAVLDDLQDMEVNCDKELLIIADSCFSGNWCKILSETLSDYKVPTNCFITIQAASSPDQCAHAGIFTPVLCELQNEAVRNEWLEDFACVDFEILQSSYQNYLKLQSPIFFSTRPGSGSSSSPIAFVECLNGTTSSFCLFYCPVFFWFCAERLDLIGALDEYNLSLVKANTAMTPTEISAMEATLSATTTTNTGTPEFVKYTGTVDKATGTCEDTYMPIVRTDDGAGNVMEIHVHYQESKGGPQNIGDVTFKQVDNKGKVKFSGAKKLNYQSLSATEKATWDTIVLKLVKAAATTANVTLSDDAQWKPVKGNKVAKSFTFEELLESDAQRKSFAW